MAAEGIRLNNFNVEFSCVVARATPRSGATSPSILPSHFTADPGFVPLVHCPCEPTLAFRNAVA